MNEYLYEFILSVKLKDGKYLEPSSLRGLFSSFNRHLKECKYPVSVIEDVAFERARKCLESKNKQLKTEGKGNRPNAAEALSDDEINILHETTFWELQTEKHQYTHFGFSIHCILVYEDVESIGKCAGKTFSSWKMQMELNICIFLKGKLKPEVELIT